MKRRIVLLGPPASGKGTQAELMKARFHLEPTSPGAMLREEKALGTPLGLEAAKHTEQGQLVPDRLVVDLVESWLRHHDSSFVFDGFPRTLGQAEALEKILNDRGTPLEAAILLDADLEAIRDRVQKRMVCSKCGAVVALGLHVPSADAACPKCGGKLVKRADDTLETLGERMTEYAAKSEPVVSYYRDRGILHSIPAGRTPDQVFGDVSTLLQDPRS